jgi:sialate O-acetylesterase
MIESNVGGTRIEPWSTAEVLSLCNIEPFVDPSNPFNSDFYLYNAMINPIIKFSITGAIWYQGMASMYIDLKRSLV